MFDDIASRYDFLNRLLSLGIDIGWRKKVVRMVAAQGAVNVLDVAAGTGDLSIAIKKAITGKVTACDLSVAMIEVGRNKVAAAGLDIVFFKQNAQRMTFESGAFDAVTCAFGVRNFADLPSGLSQMYRVLCSGGVCYILEFSQVKKRSLWGLCYGLYFKRILPLVGRWISGSKHAYSYLPSSVEEFPSGGKFIGILENAGFQNCSFIRLTGGVATIYIGKK